MAKKRYNVVLSLNGHWCDLGKFKTKEEAKDCLNEAKFALLRAIECEADFVEVGKYFIVPKQIEIFHFLIDNGEEWL